MTGLIKWFADNHVASNLLMLMVIAAGVMTLTTGRIDQSVMPEVELDTLQVSVIYPGASPEEIEKAITVRIEEAIQAIDGIKRISSTSADSIALVNVELEIDADIRTVLDEVQTQVDAIDTFPDDAETPIVKELKFPDFMISVAIYGDTDEASLKKVTERVREEMLSLEGITQVTLAAARPYEIAIEVSEESLRRYGITFDDVVGAIRRTSINLPAGSVKTDTGEIMIRTDGEASVGLQFMEIPVLTSPDGSRLLLGDVAHVNDGFAEVDQLSIFDGKPALLLNVFRVGDQRALETAAKVKEYVESAQHRMPEGLQMTTWQDIARLLQGRQDLMLRNARLGLLLVFIVLALFLRFRLAFWVSIGIPISFLGALWLMPMMGTSINIISLFAFIVVLGILVDDAIVVGENIYTNRQAGLSGPEASKKGVLEVTVPVILAVFTTIVAFVPMMMLPGVMGDFAGVIPRVVIACLIFSLVESLLILPAHLSGLKLPDPNRKEAWWIVALTKVQDFFDGGLRLFVDRVYTPLLEKAMHYRYITLAVGISTLLLTAGMVGAGWIQMKFFPEVEGDNVICWLKLPEGTPVDATRKAVAHIEDAAATVQAEFESQAGEPVFQHLLSSIGTQPLRQQQDRSQSSVSTSNLAEINLELVPSENRSISSKVIENRWREVVGQIPGATELKFSSALQNVGEPISVRLSSTNLEQLDQAAEDLKAHLATLKGVMEIKDSSDAGNREINLSITENAEALGLTRSDLARQVRQGFYGEEAQSIQRGRDEVKVMVRYPETERRSLADVHDMRIRTREGREVPFSSVAAIDHGFSASRITRVDRRRSITVSANVDESIANANEINSQLQKKTAEDVGILHQLKDTYPGLDFSFEGEQREQADSIAMIQFGTIFALLAIFTMLAITFRSYVQPALIIMVVPFGCAGAIWAHWFFGMKVTIMSFIGMLALVGVVVNDSLVMIDFINRKRREGSPLEEAIRIAGPRRFRPIMITSVTTFVGLTPMLLEKSVQAKFLIPMAVSLSYGLIFATGIVLILIPAAYMIVVDLQRVTKRLIGETPNGH